MANTLLQNQVYTILNEINAQAKTGGDMQAVDTSSFVAVAQTVLLSGYDNVFRSISQVLSKTIFSHRFYSPILNILQVDEEKWGNHVRKITPLDDEAKRDDTLPLTDGESVDPWIINNPKALQTNFYGQEMYSRYKTLYKDQLDTAFSNESEFARFISMILANARDQLTQDDENLRRMTLSNFIAGLTLCNPASVVHLLTEYNAMTGLSLTAQTVYQPANYMPFIQWASARMMNVSDELKQRGYRWHKNLTGMNIPRHTPKNFQKFIMFAPEYRRIENSALANVWHEKYVGAFEGFEEVNFFQNPDSPDEITVTPSIINNAGAFVRGDETTVSKIVGLIFDDDAIGVTNINEWSQATLMNPRGGYTNMFWHRTRRYYNDYTENAALFLLD